MVSRMAGWARREGDEEAENERERGVQEETKRIRNHGRDWGLRDLSYISN